MFLLERLEPDLDLAGPDDMLPLEDIVELVDAEKVAGYCCDVSGRKAFLIIFRRIYLSYVGEIWTALTSETFDVPQVLFCTGFGVDFKSTCGNKVVPSINLP